MVRDDEKIFFFKVISIGDFIMNFNESNNYQIKPMINVTDKRKKWGNSYLVFINILKKTLDNIPMLTPIFAGKFNVDKNLNHYIKLFKKLDIPDTKVDYHIITQNIDGFIDNEKDFIKKDILSFSKVFSCAYHKDDNGNIKSQNIFVVQDGDKYILNGKTYIYNAKTMKFSNQS